jgi:hypothetical protein
MWKFRPYLSCLEIHNLAGKWWRWILRLAAS